PVPLAGAVRRAGGPRRLRRARARRAADRPRPPVLAVARVDVHVPADRLPARPPPRPPPAARHQRGVLLPAAERLLPVLPDLRLPHLPRHLPARRRLEGRPDRRRVHRPRAVAPPAVPGGEVLRPALAA